MLNLFKRYSHLQQDQKRLYQIYSISSSKATRDRFINNILKYEFHVQKTKILNLLILINELRMNSAKIQVVINLKKI